MIPHRMLSNEIFANDLRHRVTACRKRLRRNRIHRGHFDSQVEELLETATGTSEFSGHRGDDPAVQEFLIRVRNGEKSPRVDEQKVGIR